MEPCTTPFPIPEALDVARVWDEELLKQLLVEAVDCPQDFVNQNDMNRHECSAEPSLPSAPDLNS
eukprot:9470589-Alexandrium_andersonii.AAC.1